jgi:acetoin utilization protein AcuB
MLVRDIMQTEVTTATPATKIPAVLRLLERRRVRHLPVVEGDTLVGFISDRDLKQAMLSLAATTDGGGLARAEDRLAAADIMTRTITTIGPMFAVEDAARLMVTKRISALPVTEGDRLLGIVSETDVLQLFVRAMGALEPSSRLDVVLEGSPWLSEVVQIVEGAGARISSMMTLGPAGHREIAIRVATLDPRPAIDALGARGYSVRQPRRG